MKKNIFFLSIFFLLFINGYAQTQISLRNKNIQIFWEKKQGEWRLIKLLVFLKNNWVDVSNVSGQSVLLYSESKPPKYSQDSFKTSTGNYFPENIYSRMKKDWDENTNSVALNTAGKPYYFNYTNARMINKNKIIFTYNNDYATITSTWSLDDKYSTDVLVSQTLQANKPGYFSLATPTLTSIPERNISWATVPGYFQGKAVQPDFVKAYAYGMGIPALPVIYRERCASTLCPLISTSQGITFSTIPSPGLARDPWEYDHKTHKEWFIGLSHKNRKNEFFPTLYYPVLGQPHSQLKANDQFSYTFRYSLESGDWFKTINHAVYDIYKFKDGLTLRHNTQSLTNRIERMHHYLTASATSLWYVENYNGFQIGAQSYGGVLGINHNSLKNSDYGAMWMLAKTTNDRFLLKDVLPYALNFKIAQQIDSGFFKGAVKGQYYLAQEKRFVEEWGDIIESIAVTYYSMLDIGNVLLFEPNNIQLKNLLKNGADFLLRTQKADGSWPVAYTPQGKEIFKDVPDARPTFYGLLAAYKILKNPVYLTAAKKGADWYINQNIYNGYLLGVCGDTRYASDFATGQTAQSLLDLFDITKDSFYMKAAIFTAKIYVNSIYTHPIPSTKKKIVNGRVRQDWEISQAGLSFEHGGILGSANSEGPIQLCSHAGLFIRMYGITGEPIFRDMARAAAIGRDAFVDSATSVASYYWTTMNKGAGPYPHHAWWQIGWITDYLMSEAQLRSHTHIVFPRGFITPKVGPHLTYGFAPGNIYGDKADLIIREGFIIPDDPSIDYILAKSTQKNRIYAILLNDKARPSSFHLSIHPEAFPGNGTIKSITSITNGKTLKDMHITIGAFDIQVLAIDIKKMI